MTAKQRETVEDLAAEAGVTLVPLRAMKIEQDAGCTSRSACDWTIRAGSMIWPGSAGNNNCSAGFTARNSSNKRFTYTAGHCSSGAGVTWGTGLQTIGRMGAAVNSGSLDASIISVDNSWFAFDHGGEIYSESSPGRSAAVNAVAPTLSYIWSGRPRVPRGQLHARPTARTSAASWAPTATPPCVAWSGWTASTPARATAAAAGTG